MRWRGPVIIVLAAIAAMALGLWATGQAPKKDELAAGEQETESLQSLNPLETVADFGSQMAMEAFVAQSVKPEGRISEPSPIPEEWEAPLFAVLEIDADRMPERNAALIAMATKSAVGVSRVQQECLDHLAFGLPDSQPETFVALATDSRIPVELRKNFLETVLQMRPAEVTDPLCKALVFHPEAELAQISREFTSSDAPIPQGY